MLRSSFLRVIDASDLDAVELVLAKDPASHVFVASRVEAWRRDSWRLGGEMWGWYDQNGLASVLFAGANLVPVEAGPIALNAFAERARRWGRRCASIVGPAPQVMELWRLLEPDWGPAREVRARQPMLATRERGPIAPDPLVRRVRLDEIDDYLPACVAMFTEEVGISPNGSDHGVSYRARIEDLLRAGRAFARIENGAVVFKAEIGVVSRDACQVQGVWVSPERRGQGLAAPGMAAIALVITSACASPEVSQVMSTTIRFV